VCECEACECEACVNVNLTLPVLPSTDMNKHNMRHYSKRLPRTEINKQICGTSRKAVARVCVWMRSVCEWEACANVILKLPVLASA